MDNQDPDNQSLSKNKNFFSEWLEKLQQESWQLELLISGFALYGIYEARALFPVLEIWDRNLPGGFMGFIGPLIIGLFKIGWRIFFINLFVHVVLRSMWIGAIGLRYISSEIDYKALNFSPFFDEYIRRKTGNYDEFIERLEKICSVLFSYTFLLFLFFLSLIAFTIGLMIPAFILSNLGILQDAEELVGYWGLTYVLFGLIVFIDFITLGGLKRMRGPSFSKWYSYVFRFYSTITLSFLYRPLLYNFIDNRYTRRLFFFSFPYILILLIYNNLFTVNTNPHFPSFYTEQGIGYNDHWYEDLYQMNMQMNADRTPKAEYVTPLRLSHFHTYSDVSSVFIKMQRGDEHFLEDSLDIMPFKKSGLRFTLFGNKNQKDSLLTSMENEIKQRRSDLFKLSRIYRDSVGIAVEDDVRHAYYVAKRDSIRTLRAQLLTGLESKKDSMSLKKKTDILSALISLIEIKIDSVNITDSLACYFYTHPLNNEKGIMCNFSTKFLSPGNHKYYIKRKKFKENEDDELEVSQDEYTFPFIKY